MTTLMQSAVQNLDLGLAETFVEPDAANYLRTTRRHMLEMVREGLIPGYPLDPHAKKEQNSCAELRRRHCSGYAITAWRVTI